MKKNILIIALSVFSFTKAQLNSSSRIGNTISGENAFLDASGYSSNVGVSVAKGLIFPQVDLTQFRFKINAVDEDRFPTVFDGMIVYNTTSGTNNDPALTDHAEVEEWFYYFYNPQG